ncbi:LysR family transcriptional regulator [Streptomyces canus]|uniref:LysR family transcriptional regulator n=1 Tax=Streptomyces canus TaxID=58343 RepID=UPI00225643FF|nr:LysR family transcriptional regulator [Streptomyces canus]MCX4853710.1 LysR family transcriptional regulator [Streptomyces canus]
MQAVSMSPAALDRLRVLVQIPGHSSIAAAARHLSSSRGSSLRNRLRKIEEAAGFAIIDRTAKPLATTARGCDFLREATEILRIADNSCS